MNRLLILSDYLSIRSDEHPTSIRNCSTQTSPHIIARLASTRAGVTRVADRDLQALRSAELPLRRRAWTRSEAIPGNQPTWRAPPQRLCAERRLRTGWPFDRQFSPAARRTQRDLRDQCRTHATARGSRVNRDGPGPHRLRLHQGGRHSCRHGCVLSRRRRPAIRSRGGR